MKYISRQLACGCTASENSVCHTHMKTSYSCVRPCCQSVNSCQQSNAAPKAICHCSTALPIWWWAAPYQASFTTGTGLIQCYPDADQQFPDLCHISWWQGDTLLCAASSQFSGALMPLQQRTLAKTICIHTAWMVCPCQNIYIFIICSKGFHDPERSRRIKEERIILSVTSSWGLSTWHCYGVFNYNLFKTTKSGNWIT